MNYCDYCGKNLPTVVFGIPECNNQYCRGRHITPIGAQFNKCFIIEEYSKFSTMRTIFSAWKDYDKAMEECKRLNADSEQSIFEVKVLFFAD